jgi:hypothetical protein
VVGLAVAVAVWILLAPPWVDIAPVSERASFHRPLGHWWLWYHPVCEWDAEARVWKPCRFVALDWERLGLLLAAVAIVAAGFWWRLGRRLKETP